MFGPVLFCYDGSDGSRAALASAGQLLARPVDAVVLTVWQPAAVRLAMAGGFAPGVLADESELDEEEESYAKGVAEDGAAKANESGYNASARWPRAEVSVAQTILDVADELDSRLIVCGQRGRGPIRSALLGSVSHALSGHTHRPVLIAPQKP
jgi:nucleotide-binding universal stress UspA family protein